MTAGLHNDNAQEGYEGSYPILSVGIDWVTATSTRGGEVPSILETFSRWQRAWRGVGEEPRKAGTQGYQGTSCASVFLGRREDGWMLRASGVAAQGWAQEVMRAGWHVTRIDLQVTIQVPDGGRFKHEILRQAVSGRDELARRGRRHKLTAIEGYGDGDTIAVGARTSERYGRVYDKHAETHGEYPPGAWRFEVEFKGDYASAVCEALQGGGNMETTSQSILQSFFTERGVRLPVNLGSEAIDLYIPKVDTSTDKSLRWLERNVRPTVERLIKAGKKQEVMQALGLDGS